MSPFDHAVQPRLAQRQAVTVPSVLVLATEADLPESPYSGQAVILRDTGDIRIYDALNDTWLTAGVPVP